MVMRIYLTLVALLLLQTLVHGNNSVTDCKPGDNPGAGGEDSCAAAGNTEDEEVALLQTSVRMTSKHSHQAHHDPDFPEDNTTKPGDNSPENDTATPAPTSAPTPGPGPSPEPSPADAETPAPTPSPQDLKDLKTLLDLLVRLVRLVLREFLDHPDLKALQGLLGPLVQAVVQALVGQLLL